MRWEEEWAHLRAWELVHLSLGQRQQRRPRRASRSSLAAVKMSLGVTVLRALNIPLETTIGSLAN